MVEKIDFTGIEEDLKTHGLNFVKKIILKLPNAKEILHAAMKYFIGEKFVWIDEYNQVAEWLSDNEGRGLILHGINGNGKSMLIQKAIPAIFLKYHNRVVNCYDSSNLNVNADEIMTKRFISIDDFGIEEQGVIYGNRRWVLPDVMDLSEKRGNIVLLSTNFNADEIAKKYGVRTFERMISTTKRIEFKHESFRK